AELLVKLTRSRFLFLGYSMQDWNLRVILHRIWGQQPLSYKSWAIQRSPSEIEEELWDARGVDVLDIPLDQYVTELTKALEHPSTRASAPEAGSDSCPPLRLPRSKVSPSRPRRTSG